MTSIFKWYYLLIMFCLKVQLPSSIKYCRQFTSLTSKFLSNTNNFIPKTKQNDVINNDINIDKNDEIKFKTYIKQFQISGTKDAFICATSAIGTYLLYFNIDPSMQTIVTVPIVGVSFLATLYSYNRLGKIVPVIEESIDKITVTNHAEFKKHTITALACLGVICSSLVFLNLENNALLFVIGAKIIFSNRLAQYNINSKLSYYYKNNQKALIGMNLMSGLLFGASNCIMSCLGLIYLNYDYIFMTPYIGIFGVSMLDAYINYKSVDRYNNKKYHMIASTI